MSKCCSSNGSTCSYITDDDDDDIYNAEMSSNEQSASLSVYCVTWNRNVCSIPSDINVINQLLRIRIDDDMYDIYVIGVQEAKSSERKVWLTLLGEVLGNSYILLNEVSMANMHLAIYLCRSKASDVRAIESASVATGIGNMYGNKGAVTVSFLYGCTLFLFIASHLTAHQNNVDMRNNDYNRIINELQLPQHDLARRYCPAFMLDKPVNVTNRFHRIFFMGDLNYRVNGNRSMVDQCLKYWQHGFQQLRKKSSKKQNRLQRVLLQRTEDSRAISEDDMKLSFFDVMRANDQLSIMRSRNQCFIRFSEGEVSFPPTYKFDVDSDAYDSSTKARIPSWTDRILYKTCSKNNDEIELKEYGSVSNIRCSDHRPVYASFRVYLEIRHTKSLLEAEEIYGNIDVCLFKKNLLNSSSIAQALIRSRKKMTLPEWLVTKKRGTTNVTDKSTSSLSDSSSSSGESCDYEPTTLSKESTRSCKTDQNAASSLCTLL